MKYRDKEVVEVHKTHDINGNPVLKFFYDDNTSEIIRGSEAYVHSHHWDKYYKSMSGLYGSKRSETEE
jgi:hypothetical protein